MANIQTELQTLAPSALIELFVIDTRDIDPVNGDLFYFHCGTNKYGSNIFWQGIEYIALPIETEGFDINTQGKLPKPKLRLANVQGIFSALVRELDDLIGAKIIRKRTFGRFLDAKNFPNGNSQADPNQQFPDDLWFIDRKTSETRYVIEWELASAYDLQGVKLPRRQIIQNSCQWHYRDGNCGYTGSFFDKANQSTLDVTKDCCPKTLTGCKVRWESVGSWNKVLPFGGFPGATRS